MKTFSILILLSFFSTNLLDKAESVKLELKTFDEIFGEGWWDKGEAEDLKTPAPTNFGQNVHHQIDRQNTQIGQIEPNSTDQLGQIKPNSTDQNPLPHSETDHSDNAKNGKEQNEIIKEITLNEKQKFDQMKAELKRAGFKNSYKQELDETVAKELGLGFRTIYTWKSELGQSTSNKHSDSEQKKLIKRYYVIKDKHPKISDEDIAKMLKIGGSTLYRWKKQFKRQQLHPNSFDSVDNAAANVQKIENSNSGSI
uniref:Transposase n=1 Tax=Globodera rostochiensis TaxID=31243 RepID=A0A914HSL0_GLORO